MISKLLARVLLAVMPLSAMAFDNNKPIEWVVGYAAGGGSDVVARMLADAMGKSINHTVIVTNKPGAGSNIAADYVAKVRDVDNTLFTADSAVLGANPFLFSKLSYSAEKDFGTPEWRAAIVADYLGGKTPQDWSSPEIRTQVTDGLSGTMVRAIRDIRTWERTGAVTTDPPAPGVDSPARPKAP